VPLAASSSSHKSSRNGNVVWDVTSQKWHVYVIPIPPSTHPCTIHSHLLAHSLIHPLIRPCLSSSIGMSPQETRILDTSPASVKQRRHLTIFALTRLHLMRPASTHTRGHHSLEHMHRQCRQHQEPL
jgi:hypothetical protein